MRMGASLLHDGAGYKALTLGRTIVFGLWLYRVTATPLPEFAELPSLFLNPHGAMKFIPWWAGIRTPAFLSMFRWALMSVLLLVIIGVGPRRALLVLAAVGLVVFDGIVKSHASYVNHGQLTLLYCALALSVAPYSHALMAHPTRVAAVLRLVALVVAVPYTMTGFERIVSGGYAIFVNDALPVNIVLRTLEPSEFSFIFGYSVVENRLVLSIVKAGFFVTTVAEVASPFALLNQRFRLLWIAIMVTFHIVVFLAMNIAFWENMVLILAFMTNFPRWGERVWNGLQRHTQASKQGIGADVRRAQSKITSEGQP